MSTGDAVAPVETADNSERKVLAKTGVNASSMLVALGVLLVNGAVVVWALRTRQA